MNLCLTASVAITVVNPSDIKMIFIDNNPTFNIGPISLPRNVPDCTVLENSAFNNFLLPDEIFPKALQSLEICLSVSNN